ncbi:hypothetical protein ABPG74_020053 [Tetrahymena malaccensis]
MQEQNITFKSIGDFQQSEKFAITHLDLQLNNCYFEDQELIQLQNSLAQCSEIQSLTLNLENQEIKADQMKFIFGDLPIFNNLNSFFLNLIYDELLYEGASILAQFIKKCHKLTTLQLDLYQSLIGSFGATELIEAIDSIQNIQNLEIWFGNSDIQDDAMFSLMKTIKNKSNQLTDLIIGLSENQITDEGISQICIGLNQCQNLQFLELYLYETKMSDRGLQSIATALSQIPLIAILALSLYGNQISDLGTVELGVCLGKLKNLKQLKLELDTNRIGDKGASNIFNGLINCSQISSLTISLFNNNISDQGYLEIDKFLSGLPNLLYLECYLNKNEKFLKSREIINCKNIRELTLGISLCESDLDKNYHKQKALKIKRLVILGFN